jgi:hypothetical protein
MKITAAKVEKERLRILAKGRAIHSARCAMNAWLMNGTPENEERLLKAMREVYETRDAQ